MAEKIFIRRGPDGWRLERKNGQPVRVGVFVTATAAAKYIEGKQDWTWELGGIRQRQPPPQPVVDDVTVQPEDIMVEQGELALDADR